MTGLVLSVLPVGEYDRRLTILTKERGKISAFAKGARRPNSALVGSSQPFVFARFLLFEGRSSYTVSQVEVLNYFPELRGDVELTYYGFFFCEFAEYMTREANDERPMLTLLYQSLRALTNAHIGKELTRLIFELKAYYLNGEGPQVTECVRCKKQDVPFVFRIRAGGCLCEACAGEDFDPQRRAKRELQGLVPIGEYFNLQPSTWYTLRYIASTPPEKIYSFTVNDAVRGELLELTEAWRREYNRHTFRSLAFLETLEP